MQDFQNFGEFLTVELGEQVLGRAAATGDVLEKLCAHAARLSLRCPTELTHRGCAASQRTWQRWEAWEQARYPADVLRNVLRGRERVKAVALALSRVEGRR